MFSIFSTEEIPVYLREIRVSVIRPGVEEGALPFMQVFRYGIFGIWSLTYPLIKQTEVAVLEEAIEKITRGSKTRALL